MPLPRVDNRRHYAQNIYRAFVNQLANCGISSARSIPRTTLATVPDLPTSQSPGPTGVINRTICQFHGCTRPCDNATSKMCGHHLDMFYHLRLPGHVGDGGSEWASGGTGPGDDFYVPDGGSDGDDYGADDYYSG
jgi:hypothetical protein